MEFEFFCFFDDEFFPKLNLRCLENSIGYLLGFSPLKLENLN